MKILILMVLPFFIYASSISIQILGSGGPEFSKRASSSYLIWIDGRARVLVDMGGGAFLRFTQSGAKLKDLQAIALTHLHIDHCADLPLFMKAGFFTDRTDMLPILGTVSGGDFPNIKTYLQRLFGEHGAYAYMNDILTPQSDSFEIRAITLPKQMSILSVGNIKITSIGVQHGSIPAIAYAFEIDGKKIVFSGDTSSLSNNIIKLSQNADYLIVTHAISQNAGEFVKKLHMTPLRIGEIAKQAHVKNLILAHRMNRTIGKEDESEQFIRKNYDRKIIWAEDLMKIDVF